MRMVVSEVGQNNRNGAPVGSTGVTRFGKKLNEGLFFADTTVAVSTRGIPRVPGSTQSGRRFGVTISE